MRPDADGETRVLVVDDQDPFRRAMAAVVAETDGFVVVGAVASGEESLVAVQELRPDLVLMDVNLPGIDGVEATRRIRQARDAPGRHPAVDLRRGRVRPDRLRGRGLRLEGVVQPGAAAGGVVGRGLSPLTPARSPRPSGG